jgi:hypothetical protein
LSDWCIADLQKSTVGCLIGINGELLAVNLNPSSMGMTVEEFKRRWLQAGGNISEPGFILQM